MTLEEYIVNPRAPQAIVEERQLTSLWPSRPQRLYSLTISANKAKYKDAYDAYNYIITRLPEGEFYYTHEVSRRGKFHVHGIIKFKYDFDHKQLMDSRRTPTQWSNTRYDIHIRYNELDRAHFMNYIRYMFKDEDNQIRFDALKDRRDVKYFSDSPETCIPIVQIKQYYKQVTIMGL